MSSHSPRSDWCHVLWLALISALLIPMALASRAATATEPPFAVFLPLLHRPPAGLFGRVTVAGAPAVGVSLQLYFYDGATWYVSATTTTDAQGQYVFENPPALSAGQEYTVVYLNSTNTSRLSYWSTRNVTTYSIGDSVQAGDFDVANVELTDPDSGSTVGLPYTFHWTARTATPDDTYEFNLWDYDTEDPYFYTLPPLGYLGSFTLGSLPSGFSADTEYVWGIGIYNAAEGADDRSAFGFSFWVYSVTFSRGMAGVVERVPAATLMSSDRERPWPALDK
jgi:hypothetical protein